MDFGSYEPNIRNEMLLSGSGGGVAPSGTAGSVLYLQSSGVAAATTNIFFNSTSNLVGIGTTGPTAKLHVVGNVFASNAVTTTNLYTAGITSNVSNTTFNFDTLTIPYFYATSKAGIGTTSPANILSVNSSNISLVSQVQISHPLGDWGLVMKRTANDAGTANIAFLKCRGETSNLIMQGDGIGRIAWHAVTNNTGPVVQHLGEINMTNISFTGGNADGAMCFLTRQTTDASGPVERMRILPNGNVGIGTTNPPGKMFIYGNVNASTTTSLFSIGDISGYGNGGGDMTTISSLYSSLGSGSNIVQQIGKTNDANSFFWGYNGAGYFWIAKYGNLPSSTFVINGGGQINMPLQPAFRAYYGTAVATDITSSQILPYNATQVNIGSCYSTSTYKFTAPVNGTYAFGASTYTAADNAMWDIQTTNLGTIARCEWRVNAASQVNNSIISTTTIVSLSANDTVWVQWTGNTVRMIGASRYISFWGYLIG